MAVADLGAAVEKAAMISRVEAAVRVRCWLDASAGQPDTDYVSARDWLTGYARDLAWVDRELNQLRRGAQLPAVANAFGQLIRSTTQRHRRLDLAFARVLPSAAEQTPSALLAVETVLPSVVAGLVGSRKTWVIAVDGMSMPVAIEIAESIVGSGLTEVVRATDGGRGGRACRVPHRDRVQPHQPVHRLPAHGRRGSGAHPFWPASTRVQLVHKDGLAGRDGDDLGTELAEAFTTANGKQVVAVVLNAVDESLPTSRQVDDPTWHYRDVPGLRELLERGALAGWVVVLVSDHGHVLDHDSIHQPGSSGGARWRLPSDRSPAEDEVPLRGPRVSVPGSRPDSAATGEHSRAGTWRPRPVSPRGCWPPEPAWSARRDASGSTSPSSRPASHRVVIKEIVHIAAGHIRIPNTFETCESAQSWIWNQEPRRGWPQFC